MSCKRALESDSESRESEGVEPKRSCVTEKLIIDLTGGNDEEEEDASEQLNCPPADVADYYSCSDESKHLFIRQLGIKHFLIDHDYILFPYCITDNEGRREKPSNTRVSKIIESSRDDRRYTELVETLQEMDTLLNKDTSERTDTDILANKVLCHRSLKSKDSKDFIYRLKDLVKHFINRTDHESFYRAVFAAFLGIVSSRFESVLIWEEPQVEENLVSFPNWNKRTRISGKPDIVIKKHHDFNRTSTLAVIECKRYRELKFMFENTEIKDDNDLQKALPAVRFCKVVKTSGNSDEVAKKERNLERMYRDLDAAICRSFKQDENNYFSSFLAQLVGEVLAWFKTSDEIPVVVPLERSREKSVRYGIAQLGFKIIFVTVGINNSFMEHPPHIRIGERRGMGLDVFMTRPFDLMIADDRAKIRDILFAMMAMARVPAEM